MGAEPPALGKGLFGYRKSAVNQILSDRDVMLRQAEGRVRAAESKVAQLEGELTGVRDRNTRMEEQLERLRVQLNILIAQGTTADVVPAMAPEPAAQAPIVEEPVPEEHEGPAEEAPEAAMDAEPEPYGSTYWETPAEAPSDDFPPAAEEAEGPAQESPPEAAQWHPEETAEPATAVEGETAPEPEASSIEAGAAGPLPAEPHDYQPGFDADAFGYHGAEYPEEEAPQSYRYEWPSAAPTPEGTPTVMPEATPESEPAPADDTWSGLSMGSLPPEGPIETSQHAEPPAPQPAAPSDHGGTDSHPASPSQPAAEAASRFVTEELAGILTAAEESATRIVERARETSERQMERSNRLWSEVQAEVARFASWRDEVEPVIRTVQSKVENVRAFIEEVPERIREALAPMAESISSIDSDLAELSAACNPPLLLTPSVLQGEGDEQPPPVDATRQESSSEGSHDDPFGGSSFGYSAS